MSKYSRLALRRLFVMALSVAMLLSQFNFVVYAAENGDSGEPAVSNEAAAADTAEDLSEDVADEPADQTTDESSAEPDEASDEDATVDDGLQELAPSETEEHLMRNEAGVVRGVTGTAATKDIVDSGTAGNLTWSLDSNGVLTISGSGDMDNYSYSNKAPWASYATSIKKIIIEDGVTSIGTRAFEDCSNLTMVTISDSVTFISSMAFAYCSGLKTITIPNSVTSFGGIVFDECASLTKITLPFIGKSLEEGGKFSFIFGDASMMPTTLTDVVITGNITEIGDAAFSGCRYLKRITIPDSVTSIGTGAFSGCSGLSSLTIPNGVTNIGASAFSGCTGIYSISIPNGVTEIKSNTFYSCSKLSSVSIPDSVTSIGESAFYDCSSLKSISLPKNVTSIESKTFRGCSALASITLPEGLKSIGSQAFFNCQALKSIEIPGSVENITGGAFSSNYALESITIKNGVKNIERGAFIGGGCKALKTLTIPYIGGSIDENCFLGYIFGDSSYDASTSNVPSSLKKVIVTGDIDTVPDNAFYKCSNLTEIVLPETITGIGNNAFYGCSGLIALTISDLVTNIGTNAFNGVNATFYIKKGSAVDDYLKAAGKTIEYICDFGHVWDTEFTVDKEPTCAEEGSQSLHCSVCKAINEDSVTAIPMIEHTYGSWTVTKEASCYEEGERKSVCTACGAALTEAIPLTDHTWSNEYTVDKEPTCAEEGSESKHCKVCDAINESSIRPIAVIAHTYGDWSVTTEPTCTENGIKEKTCLVCGNTITEEIPAGHVWGDWAVTLKPTCVNEGVETRVCERDSSHKETRPIAATGNHTWNTGEVTTSATCEEDGVMTYTCSVCGATKTEAITKLGHKWGDWTVTTEPTCGAKGVETRTCKNDSSHTETREIAATGNHTWDNGTVTSAATCDEAGTMTYTCSVCGATKTEAIPKLGHKWGDWAVTTEPTCGAKGIETRTCANDSSHTETREIAATGDHSWDDGEVTSAATCDDDGVMTYTCSVCGETRTEAITKLGHKWGDWTVTTKPTCGAEGVETRICENDPSHIQTRPIAATGNHTWDQGKVTTPATCKKDGVKTYTCSVCGETRTEAIPATGVHTWNEGEITTPAGCETEGVKTYTCTVCGETRTEEIPAIGHHEWGEWTVTTEPTCVDKGVETRFCKHDPSHTETRDVAALGHSYKDTVVAPTSTTGGYTLHECTRCGYSYRDNETDPVSEVVAGGHCGASAKWQYYADGKLRIYGTGPMDDYEVKDYASSIETTAPWAAYRRNIKKVVVEDGITSVGACTLWQSEITSAVLAESVESIGEKAFFSCDSMTSISMPGVKHIGDSAFYYCEGLTAVTLPDGLISIGQSAFGNCNKLVNINIPKTVTSIGNSAFSGCTKLVGTGGLIELPEGLTEIAGNTFYNCQKITTIYVPVSVTSIGASAFSSCLALQYVIYGGDITQLYKINISSSGNEKFINAQIGVEKYDLANAELTLERSAYQYTGSEIKPDLRINCNGYEPVEDKDYSIEYTNNVEIGKGTITITGKGNFEGTASLDFNIYDSIVDINDCEIALGFASTLYTGEAIEPPVTVTYNETELIADTDYTVVYDNNVDPGTANVTITGLGPHYGSVTKQFTIIDSKISLDKTRSIMCIDTKMKLTVTSADPKVRWKSSNTNIATVASDGTVTALIPGTVTITASNTKASASCRITVKDYAYLGGSDSRVVTRKYHHSTIQQVRVYAYTTSNGHDVAITYVNYKIINNYKRVTLHDFTDGTVTDDIDTYYKTLIDRYYGIFKEPYRIAYEAALAAQVEILKGNCRYYDPLLADGSVHTVGGNKYKIISDSYKTVSFNKAKNAKSITVPPTVNIRGRVYKVTTVDAKAFTAKKIRKVTIGANVNTIKKNAFKGSKATTLTLKTKLLTKAKVKGSLSGSKIKTVKVSIGAAAVNKQYVKTYKKFFTKANAGKKVTVK